MTSSASPSDERLLASARAGDDAAFARLLERHDEDLHTLVYRLLDGVGAEQVLEEAYAKAYRARRRQSGRVRPWLVRRALIEAIEENERRRRRQTGGFGRKPRPADQPPAPDAGPLGALPSDQKAVVVMVDELGWPLEEVATVLATEPRRAGRLLRQGRRALATGADGAEPDERPDAAGDVAPVEDRPADMALPPPVHGAGYWEAIGTRLLAERERPPAAPAPVAPPAGGAEEPEARRPHHDPATGRQQAVVVAPVQGVDGLVRTARFRRARGLDRARLVRIAGVVAVVAVAAAGLALLVRRAADTRSPVRENSVGEVATRVANVLAGSAGLDTAVVRTDVDRAGEATETTWLVATRADGSWFVQGPGRGARYDATTGTLRTRTQAGDRTSFTETTGLAAAPPFPAPLDEALPTTDLATALRALQDVDDERAEASRNGGRAAWLLSGDLTGPVPAGGADRVSLVVDQATLVPREVSFWRGDDLVRRLRMADADVEAAGPLPALEPDPGVTPTTIDQGFATVSLSQAAALAGTTPPRPAWLPPGMEVERVAVRAADKAVSVRYGRGVAHVGLSVRPEEAAGPGPDPFPPTEAGGTTQSRTLDGGRFRGAAVSVRAMAGSPSRLWGVADGVAFTVSGDVTADELVRIAESLR